uniref:ABC transmembrane type-1 domain-containing protein n=1 Tax=Macrostomum lignano TaxID=282301 RepID=A0A1I8JNI9_9PLAT
TPAVSVERICKLPNVRLRNDADVGRLEHGQQLELPQPPLKRPRRGGKLAAGACRLQPWRPAAAVGRPRAAAATCRTSYRVPGLRVDRKLRRDGCRQKADLQLIGQVVSDAFKRWREAYAELLESTACCCLHVGLLCWRAPLFGRAELDAACFENCSACLKSSDAADDLAETEACAGDFLDQLDDKLAKLGSTGTHRCQKIFCFTSRQPIQRRTVRTAIHKSEAKFQLATHSKASSSVSLAAAVLLSSLGHLWQKPPKRFAAPTVSSCLFGAANRLTKPTKACKHLVRQHLNPPVMEEDIREAVNAGMLGGAVLLSAAGGQLNTLSVLCLYSLAQIFSDLRHSAWLIESSVRGSKTRVALEHSELSLPASTAPQEMSQTAYEAQL